MTSPARLRSVWAAGWAPCLGSLPAVLPSSVRPLAGIPGKAELPTVVGIWAGLEPELHGQAGLLSRAALHDRAVRLAGLCAQQLGSAAASGSKAVSGHRAPLQMGVEVTLCSWAGLLAGRWFGSACAGLSDGLGSCPGPLARLACQAGPEATSGRCLRGVVERALPPGQPAGRAPKLGRTAN